MTETGPTRSRLLVVVALLVGLGVGLGSALLLADRDEEAVVPAVVSDTTRDADPEALAELPDPEGPVDPSAAEDPEAALRGFLLAEAEGEWERSYDFLTAAQQEVAYPTAAVWVRDHANFPRVTGFRIDDVAVDDEAGTATITTLTGFEPVLDPVLGLVAARGRTTWGLERGEDGLWRVDPSATANQPLYPSSEGAADAVRTWVDQRVACEDATDLESGLIGSPALARMLCDEAQGEIALGEVGPLRDSADTAPLLARFGPEVFTWARAVRVDAATPLTAVLAPVGEEWRVVAAIPA